MDVEEASTCCDEYKTDCFIHYEYNDYTQYSLVLVRLANLVKEENGGNNNKIMGIQAVSQPLRCYRLSQEQLILYQVIECTMYQSVVVRQ